MFSNAERIKTSALRQLNEKGIEALMESSDYLASELKRAYWNYRSKAGEEEANKLVRDLANLPF